MFLSSFEKLRSFLNSTVSLYNLVDFGTELFDGKVGHNPIVAWVTKKQFTGKRMTAIRLIDYCYSRRNEKEIEFFNSQNRYYPNQEGFSKIPGMPIAYWLSGKVLKICEMQNVLKDYGSSRQGLATTDNNLYLRRWYEVKYGHILFGCISCFDAQSSGFKWFPYNKGGAYRKWSPINEYIVNYQNDGFEIKSAVLSKYPYLKTPGFVVKNTETYFKHGITWSDVSSGKFSCRYVNNGFIYDAAGPMYFSKNDFIMIGYFNSIVFELFLTLTSSGLHYSTGHISKIPFDPAINDCINIKDLSKENIRISKTDCNSFETSWDFTMHPLIAYRTTTKLADAFEAWQTFTDNRFTLLKTNEEELNRIFIDIYGLQDELTPEVAEKDVTIRRADLGRDIRSFVSYAVGCMFGRYSLVVEGLAYAGGEWDDNKYRTFIPDTDNVLPITDEEYFEDDIVSRFIQFVKQVYGPETLEENLDFIANALGNKGNSSREVIRQYFLRDFFKNHCQIYQKRPIYWLFDSGKADGFKALIYLHRYDADTIGNLRVDYLHRLQRIYESEIVRMQEMIDNSKDAREVSAAQKRKEKLVKQLQETKVYDEKIAHLALARIELDLDDGVAVNYEKLQTGTDGRKLEVLAKIL